MYLITYWHTNKMLTLNDLKIFTNINLNLDVYYETFQCLDSILIAFDGEYKDIVEYLKCDAVDAHCAADEYFPNLNGNRYICIMAFSAFIVIQNIRYYTDPRRLSLCRVVI